MYGIIKINNLLFDENNPRLESIANQSDALQKIISDQGSKLTRLAQDIVDKKSTNPSELPIVIPAPEDKGRYIVLEGNRRLAALTLLSNQALINTIEDESIKSEFQKLFVEFQKSPILELQCYIAKSREEADHWRLLRHTGQNGGVGIMPWESSAIARFGKLHGRSNSNDLALQVLDTLDKSPLLSGSTRQKLENMEKITNFARLINDPYVRSAIGVKSTKGIVDVNSFTKDTIKNIEVVLQEVAEPNFRVKRIYNKDDRKTFLDTLGIKPDETTAASTNTATEGQSNQSSQSATEKQDQPTKSDNKPKRSTPLSTDRKTLIPSSTIIKINHSRINKIYRELRTLEVDSFENCAAAMLRVFLELSVDEYASNKNVHGYSEDSKLRNKIKSVADYMEAKEILDKKKLKAIRIETEKAHGLISVDTLHAYIHNRHVEPSAKDLKTSWNNIEVFIVKLWE